MKEKGEVWGKMKMGRERKVEWEDDAQSNQGRGGGNAARELPKNILALFQMAVKHFQEFVSPHR